MKKSSFYILGKHSVIGALKNPLRKVLRVFLTEDSKNKINRENQSLNLLKNIKVYYKTKKELDKYVGKDQINHQGFVAEIEHLDNFTLKDFLNKNQNKNNINFVALDDVTDPRNILASCSVILNGYAGTTYNNKNLFNVYGFLEHDPTDQLTDYLIIQYDSRSILNIMVGTGVAPPLGEEIA